MSSSKDELIRDINQNLLSKENKLKDLLEKYDKIKDELENITHDIKCTQDTIESIINIKSYMEKYK